MILEDVTQYLREVPPLNFLEPARLIPLARQAALEYYPSGTPILGPGGSGEGFVHVLKKGRVRCDGEMLCEGAIFGMPQANVGLEDGANPVPSRLLNTLVTAVAEEDAVCYLFPPDALERAVSGREDVADMLAGRFTRPVLELGLAGLSREMPAWLDSRPLALMTAGEAAKGREGAVPEDTSIGLTAEAMSASGMNALVVLGSEGRPCGVVTDKDFRSKAVGLASATPVKEIMNSPVLSVDASASCFDALLAMTRHSLRHVVVLHERRAVGLVSAQDLLLLRVGSPPALAAAAAKALSVEELAVVAARLPGLALGLLREGAHAGSLGRIAGGLRERCIARLAELAEERFGPPPVGYCLMLLGAAARRDGPALGPVWTAIIHEDAPSLRRSRGVTASRPLTPGALAGLGALPGTPGLFGSAMSVDEYFRELGRFVVQGLDALGMSGPEGASQAGSPSVGESVWQGGLAHWKELYAQWAGNEVPLPDSSLLDFRPVHGQLWLAEALRAEVGQLAAGHRAFLARLANDAGEDLAALVRLFSLEAGVPRIASVERAGALGRVHPLVRDMASETVHAMEYVAARQWLEASGPSTPLSQVMLGLCRTVSRYLAGRLPGRFNPSGHAGGGGA